MGTLNQNLSAQILEVTIAVEGMTWGGWAARAGKALKRLEGVRDAKANLETKSVQVTLKPGEKLYPGKLKEAVETTGFTPGDIQMKAKGEIVANSDKEL